MEEKSNLNETVASEETNLETDKSNNENPLSCDVCGKTLSSRKCLKRHKLIHTRSLEETDRNETDSSEPTKSTEAANKEKPYVCDECGRSLSSQKSLKRHIKIHTKYKEENKVFPKVTKTTYECEFCQKGMLLFV